MALRPLSTRSVLASGASLLALGTPLLALLACRGTAGEGSGAPSASSAVGAVGKSGPSVSAVAGGSPRAVPRGSADVTSGASTPWNTGPAVVSGATVDGAALRKRHAERLGKLDGPVVVLQGKPPRQLGEALCQQVVPRVSATTPVLIKPNFGGFSSLRNTGPGDGDNGVSGRTVDPEFVRGIIDCLKARGHTRITVAESWGGGRKQWERLLELSGYAQLARDTGVPLLSMADDGYFDTLPGEPGKPLRISGMGNTMIPNLLMPKLLAEHLEHGLFIAVPKLKTHRFSVVSLSIKNLMGNVMLTDGSPTYQQKFKMHKELHDVLKQLKKKEDGAIDAYHDALDAFAGRMVDLLALEAPHVTLVEGTPAVGGDGFEVRYPVTERVAIGGTNPIAVDVIGSRFLGLWKNTALRAASGGKYDSSPLITRALKRFKLDAEAIRVEGDGAALVSGPRPYDFDSMGRYAIHSPLADRTKPTLTARQAPTAPTIDGDPSDAVWQSAEPADFDTDYRGRSTGLHTELRMAWRADGLYALFTVHHPELTGPGEHPVAEEHEKLYDEDCVELFLDPEPSTPKTYYEVEAGLYGHFLDLSVNRERGTHDTSWSSGLQLAARRHPERNLAVVELAMSAPELVSALKAGARLSLGAFRVEKLPKGRQYLAWSPARTGKPQFHVPEALGTLLLAP